MNSSGKVAWTSRRPAVATVDSDGSVTSVDRGTTWIDAAAKDPEPGTNPRDSTLIEVRVAQSVSLTGADAVWLGNNLRITAAVDAEAGKGTLRWGHQGPLVFAEATTNAGALVRADALGSATVSAWLESDPTVRGSVQVTITRIPVDSVVVPAASPPRLFVGESLVLDARVYGDTGSVLADRTVTFTSPNSSVVSIVPTSGKVTGLAPGTANIVATSEGKASAPVVVTVSLVPVASVDVQPDSISLPVGSTTKAKVIARDAVGGVLTGRDFDVTNPSPHVATTNKILPDTIAITCVAQGTTTLTVTVEPKSKQLPVACSPVPVAAVTLEPSTVTPYLDDPPPELRIVVKDASGNELPGRASTAAVASSDPTVATAEHVAPDKARVTGVSEGTVTVTATVEAKTGFATVSFRRRVDRVEVTPASHTLPAGSTVQLTATVKDPTGVVITREPAWSSTAENVATVSKTGLVVGVAPGTAIITATSENRSGTATITVSCVVSTITVAPPSLTLILPASQQLAVADNCGGTPAVDWESTSPGIASVSTTGVVTAAGHGQATITATLTTNPNVKAQVPVSVLGVTSVAVAPDSIRPGWTRQMVATVSTAHTNVSKTVSWSSTNQGVATVHQATGLVTGVAPGLTTITATSTADGTRKGSVQLKVGGCEIPIPIQVGQTQQGIAACPNINGGGHEQFLYRATAANSAFLLTASRADAFSLFPSIGDDLRVPQAYFYVGSPGGTATAAVLAEPGAYLAQMYSAQGAGPVSLTMQSWNGLGCPRVLATARITTLPVEIANGCTLSVELTFKLRTGEALTVTAQGQGTFAPSVVLEAIGVGTVASGQAPPGGTSASATWTASTTRSMRALILARDPGTNGTVILQITGPPAGAFP